MNPSQEYVIKEALIGLMRGIATAIENLQAQLLPSAAAHQRADADLRAIRQLRQMAISCEQDPNAAELRYWEYVDSGWSAQRALQVVREELKHQ